jgi:hypothetical protein
VTPIGLTDSFKKEKRKEKKAQESIGLISGNKKEKKEREGGISRNIQSCFSLFCIDH